MSDVIQGDFAFDHVTGKVVGPASREARQYLDPKIAGEGTKVRLSNGSEITWSPPPTKTIMPDWSQVKHLQKYFNRREYQFFPCWLYHPHLPPVCVLSAQEAGEDYGVELKVRTEAERQRYGGGEYRWEFSGEWRTTPFTAPPPTMDTVRKNVIAHRADPIADLARLLGGQVRVDPARIEAKPEIDQAMLDEFRQFQQWKATQAAMREAAARGAAHAEAALDEAYQGGGYGAPAKPEELDGPSGPTRMPGPTGVQTGSPAERDIWIQKAGEAGIHVDHRWSAATLRKHVMDELQRRVVEAGQAEHGGDVHQ